MKVIRTHNQFHLGDNLIHLNFLRRLASAHPDILFEHKTHAPYIESMRGLVTDLQNISFVELTERPVGSIDSWRGANGFWYQHPNRNDFVGFHLDHFSALSYQMGLPNPITKREDMLFDAPILNPENGYTSEADVFLIDSAPQSNQWAGYTPEGFEQLKWELHERGLSTISSEELRRAGWPLETRCILAAKCKYIIGTAHGPLWPCLTVWTDKTTKRFILFIGNGERVNVCNQTVCTPDIMDALNHL